MSCFWVENSPPAWQDGENILFYHFAKRAELWIAEFWVNSKRLLARNWTCLETTLELWRRPFRANCDSSVADCCNACWTGRPTVIKVVRCLVAAELPSVSWLTGLRAFILSLVGYVTFQRAEVLLSRCLFHEILERIHRLKPVPIGAGLTAGPFWYIAASPPGRAYRTVLASPHMRDENDHSCTLTLFRKYLQTTVRRLRGHTPEYATRNGFPSRICSY